MGQKLAKLYRLKQTVFTFDEIGMYWQVRNTDRLKSSISYYVKQGDLLPLRRGIYATTSEFDPLELAGRIYAPSYVSLESVLTRAGSMLQYTETTTVVSYCTRTVEAGGYTIRLRKIADALLTDPDGVQIRRTPPVVSMASPERALVDLFYLDGQRYLDNPDTINWKRAFNLAQRFNNKRLLKEVKECAEKYLETPPDCNPVA